MISRALQSLSGVKTLHLILAMTALKALLFFVALPIFQEQFSTMYGIEFADNYQLLGENLAEGNGYKFTYDTAPTLMREAGYPLTLAALFSVFGFSLNIARAANLLFAAASAMFVARIAEKASGSAVGSKIAALLFMVHPGVVVAEMRGGVESLFIMLLMCFFIATYRALESRKLSDYFLAGLVLGIAANVRGTALLFPSFLVLYFFFWERPRPSLVLVVTRVTIMVVGSVIALTPWIVRNYELVGKFAPTASVAGVSSHAGQYICKHLSFSNNLVDVDGDAALERAQMARDQGYKFKEITALYYLYFFDVHDEVEFNSYMGKQVRDNYLASPSLLFGCAAKNAFNFWFAGKNWTSTAMNAVVQLPYIILGFAGLIIGLRGHRRAHVGLLGLFILYTLGIYLPILAQARYSVALMPVMSVLAAVAIMRWARLRDDQPLEEAGGQEAPRALT